MSDARHEDPARTIRAYESADEHAVVALWAACGLTRPWNDPHRDIARKCATQPELFLVGVQRGTLVATAMVGYEGHRGWIYYLAVDPVQQRSGWGRTMMQEAERRLVALGCPKLNLQLRTSNVAAAGFYRALGYVEDDAISFGKRLIVDAPERAA